MAVKSTDGEILLKLSGVTKSFPGVKALNGVDFELKSGEVHTLMGENGAGKSTLIKVLTGVLPPDDGKFELDGLAIHPRSPLEAQKLGISTVYQEVNLIPSLSVAENLILGHETRKWGQIQWRANRKRAEDALARLGLKLDVRQTLGTFSIAIRQMVAIARALSISDNTKVLILDEPTSSLDAEEVEQLFKVLKKLREDGLGIVFVSHFLDQVYAISDRITVLRNGQRIGCYHAADLPRLELVAQMIGRTASEVEELEKPQALTAASTAAPVLKAEGLARGQSVRGMNVELRSGEVVGLAGLLGSGRSETARLLFGLDKRSAGTIEVEGGLRKLKNPREAIDLRMALLAEDRKAEGIFPNLSIRENIAIALQTRRGWLKPLSKGAQNKIAQGFIKSLRIATPDAEKPVGQLSGGNQQKALLARCLAAEPKILFLDEPTRGIDVGARAEIEAEISRLAGDGLAILLISSELEEVVRSSHRVIVLRDGAPVAEFIAPAATSESLMEAIARG